MTRSAIVFSCIAALAAGVLLALGVAHFAEAQALDAGLEVATNPAARATVPDVTSDPGWFLDHIRALWKSGAISSAIILGLFGVLSAARAKIGWFAKGRQAAIVAAVLGSLGMLAGAILSGGSINLSMVLSALMSGFMLWLHPVKPEGT